MIAWIPNVQLLLYLYTFGGAPRRGKVAARW
jgi:hypothetical protein